MCMSRFIVGLLRISVDGHGGGTRMSTGTVVFASVGEEEGGVFGVDLGGGDEEAEDREDVSVRVSCDEPEP